MVVVVREVLDSYCSSRKAEVVVAVKHIELVKTLYLAKVEALAGVVGVMEVVGVVHQWEMAG